MSRTVTRGLTALALGGLTSLTMLPVAHAASCPPGTYPPGHQCTPFKITVTIAFKGQTITITVKGYGAFTKVRIVLHSTGYDLGTFTTDANGDLTANVTIPDNVPAGDHTITASGTAPDGSVRILSTPVTVKKSGGGSGLPFTGFELGAASLLGAGLLGAGTIAVVSGRKRKDSVTV